MSDKDKFSAPVQTSPGAKAASYSSGAEPFLGRKTPGRGDKHPPQSKVEVKESVEK